MRFIYEWNDTDFWNIESNNYNEYKDMYDSFLKETYYTIEDTQTPDGINIIWLINSQSSYLEMERYYERYN